MQMMNVLKSFNSTSVDQPRRNCERTKEPGGADPKKSTTTTTTKAEKRRRISWQINNDIKLSKNRKIVDGHLHRLRHVADKPLSLNADGICYFPYKKFIIVVEVPEDNGGVVFIYTMCYRLDERDNQSAVLVTAMELNYMQVGTRGATLGVDGDEYNLCFSIPINRLTKESFVSCLEDFMQTASEMNECLSAARFKKRWSL